MKRGGLLAIASLFFVVAALASGIGYAQDAVEGGKTSPPTSKSVEGDKTSVPTSKSVEEAKTSAPTSKSKGGAKPAVAQTAHQKAMAQCETYYGGQRGTLGGVRYFYIEQCFKNATGMSPAQAKLNCKVRNC